MSEDEKAPTQSQKVYGSVLKYIGMLAAAMMMWVFLAPAIALGIKYYQFWTWLFK